MKTIIILFSLFLISCGNDSFDKPYGIVKSVKQIRNYAGTFDTCEATIKIEVDNLLTHGVYNSYYQYCPCSINPGDTVKILFTKPQNNETYDTIRYQQKDLRQG